MIDLSQQSFYLKINISDQIIVDHTINSKLISPLEMRWRPKEDITAYELAKCLPYLLSYNGVMPHQINQTESHFRHFEIINYNE